jgi:hypothetical protein
VGVRKKLNRFIIPVKVARLRLHVTVAVQAELAWQLMLSPAVLA